MKVSVELRASEGFKKWPEQIPLHWSQSALPHGRLGSGMGKGMHEIEGPPLYQVGSWVTF